MSIDWSKPIVTVDGRSCTVKKVFEGGVIANILVENDTHSDPQWTRTYNIDGKHTCGEMPDIRNVQPDTPNLTARMEKLVREMAGLTTTIKLTDSDAAINSADRAHKLSAEARAIAALLHPVEDVDLVEARKIVAEAVAYGAGISTDPDRKRPQDFRDGACDAGGLITRTLAAIRKGPTQNNR